MKPNISTFRFFLCLLRFGVEQARFPNYRPFGIPGEGSCDQRSVGRELPILDHTPNLLNTTINKTPCDRDQLGQESQGSGDSLYHR